jgi:hypothetical protein
MVQTDFLPAENNLGRINMQNATSVSAYATFHLEGRPPLHADVHIVRDAEPSGIMAGILHKVRNCPLIVRIGAVAFPILAFVAQVLTFNATLPADHLFKTLMPFLSLALPFLYVYECIDLMREVMAQMSCDYGRG